MLLAQFADGTQDFAMLDGEGKLLTFCDWSRDKQIVCWTYVKKPRLRLRDKIKQRWYDFWLRQTTKMLAKTQGGGMPHGDDPGELGESGVEGEGQTQGGQEVIDVGVEGKADDT